jgi:hypothetical protein
MDRHGRARWPALRAALALIAGSALIGLAACGSVTGGGQAAAVASRQAKASAAAVIASAGVPLCVDEQKVDRVAVQLTGSVTRAFLPRGITITDVPRVRALAAAVCALPPLPHGLHCPAALSGALRLLFAAGGHDYRPVRIQDSGCAPVTGVGPTRQWSWSSTSGRLLSRAVGGKGQLVPGTHPSSVPTP